MTFWQNCYSPGVVKGLIRWRDKDVASGTGRSESDPEERHVDGGHGAGVRVTALLKRDLPCFDPREQRDHALQMLRGKLSALHRKTC